MQAFFSNGLACHGPELGVAYHGREGSPAADLVRRPATLYSQHIHDFTVYSTIRT